MSKRDILFLCQFFYPEYITSALLPFQTAQHLSNEGYKVSVLTGFPKEYTKDNSSIKTEEIIDNISIKRIKYLQLQRGSKLSRLINYFSFTVGMLLNIRYLKNFKVVFVYSNPPILPIVPILAKYLFGIKIIFVAYDIYPEIAIKTEVILKSSLISWVMTLINKLLYKNVSKVIALSSEMKRFIAEERKLSSDKIEIIPNWATEENLSMNITKKKFNNITYLGNMGIAQDLDTIIEGIKMVSKIDNSIRFSFAGHGNQKYKIEELSNKYNLKNVHVFPFLEGEELLDLMSKSDAFIVSLKNELSGLAVPSKFYTYLKTGKPIISIMNSENDISKEIVDYNIGYSVSNGDTEGFTKAILNVLNYDGKGNNKIEEKIYSKEIQLNKYSEVVKNVLKGFN